MKFLRGLTVLVAFLLAGAATGLLLDHANWNWSWPYLGIDWLAAAYDADGEAFYDRQSASLVLHWIATFALAWLVFVLVRLRRKRALAFSSPTTKP